MRLIANLCAVVILTGLPVFGSTLLDFEGLNDLQQVNDFYPGLTFSHAVAEIAGFSLNDAELPPASGATVALNDDGLMLIDWSSPAANFDGLFTYTAPLTLRFFLSGVAVGSSASAFGNNLALSGEPGSNPNESISFTSGIAFDSLLIDSAGSYGVDDISFDANAQVAPEPATTLPSLVCIAALLYAARRFRFFVREVEESR